MNAKFHKLDSRFLHVLKDFGEFILTHQDIGIFLFKSGRRMIALFSSPLSKLGVGHHIGRMKRLNSFLLHSESSVEVEKVF